MNSMSFFHQRDDDDGSSPDSMSGMDMSSSSSSSSSPSSSFGEGMSTAFYASTDTSPSLWLSAFTPTSPGAVAAACLALAVLACVYRLLMALERVLVRGWSEQATKRDRVREERRGGKTTRSPAQSSGEDATMEAGHSQAGTRRRRRRNRAVPGWWAGVDVPRGLYQVLLSGVGYLLMLSVMTFNVYYFISILLGLGLGESLFGRIGRSAHPPSRSSSSQGTAGNDDSTSSATSSSGGFRSFSGEGSPLELDGTRLEELNRQGKRYEGASRVEVSEEREEHSPLRRPLLLRGGGGGGQGSSTSSGSSVKVEGTEGADHMQVGVAR